MNLTPEPQVYVFDARGIAHRFRHSAIFGALNALRNGETMRFTNDHDPIPLLAQLNEHFGDYLSIDYVSREPGAVTLNFSIHGLPED